MKFRREKESTTGDRILETHVGLSEEERLDLQKLIGEFQQAGSISGMGEKDQKSEEIEALNKRLAHLTQVILTIDRRMKPIYEIIRLSLEKNEILNQRINAIIDAIRSGESL